MNKYFEVNEPGLNIKCKIYCNDIRNINSVILSCHGFGGNKENAVTKKLAEILLPKYDDLAIISFDLPCHGKDIKQKLNLSDCDEYVDAMINYIKNNLKAEDIFVQATSFGGYLILKHISEKDNPFKKIAIRCPAINMYNVIADIVLKPDQLENINKGKIETVGFDRKAKIDKSFLQDLKENDITKRSFIDMADDILIMHGTNDEVVPYEDDLAFCEENVIDFITIEGADHRYKNPAKLRECINHITDFYEESLNSKKSL